MRQHRNKAPRPGQSDLQGAMVAPYPAQNPPGGNGMVVPKGQQDPNLGNIAGGRIQPYPVQGSGISPMPDEELRMQEQGVIYLSNFGNYYRVPKYTTSMIRKYQDNVYAAGIYHKQRHQLFRNKYQIVITDPNGEDDTDECVAIASDMMKMCDAVMVQPHMYGLWSAIQMSWADTFWFGMSMFNPVWDWEGNEYVLQKLRHLPADSFGTQPYGRPFLYSDILQGVVISPFDGSVEYFQTLYMPQNNAPPGPVVSTQFLQTKLTNIVTIKDPAFPDLTGKPVMLPIFPLIAMLDFAWQAQTQKVNRVGGGGVMFLKIINPQGNDIDYGQLLLQNWGKNSAFQLRQNFELITPNITDSGSALETIEALDRLITKYSNPADQVQRATAAPISGASNSEAEMVNDYIKNIHTWLEEQWSHILQEYLDVNGYEGYTVLVDIPEPSIDRADMQLKQAIAGAQYGYMTTNELRKLGAPNEIEDLDDAGLVALRADIEARKPQPPPAFGGSGEPQAEGEQPPAESKEKEAAAQEKLMQKAELAIKAAKIDELDPWAITDKDRMREIVNAALDSGDSAIPQNEDDDTESIGGTGITQASYFPNGGEAPADVIKILTESYQFASGGSKYPPDSASRDMEAIEFAWKAVAKSGWSKGKNGEWTQVAGTASPAGV